MGGYPVGRRGDRLLRRKVVKSGAPKRVRCRETDGTDHERPNMALGGITPAMKLALAA